MATTDAPVTRPDIDILDAIQLWMTGYPPLVNDRKHIQVRVEDGVVLLSGNVKTPITRSYLLSHIKQIAGVQGVDDSALHDDETIRLSVGPVLTNGTIGQVEWGTVILAGKLPEGPALDALVERIGKIAGVKRVVMPA
ncbi:MAG: BON domain-containing protein [Anaerolineae bacterium]|nr:BON domain-containing protein [Anaerolineae bacterium]